MRDLQNEGTSLAGYAADGEVALVQGEIRDPHRDLGPQLVAWPGDGG